jgi:ribonuclease P/MRP protein subunit RPP1
MPFHLKRSSIGAALANGVVFEICYGAAVGAEDVYAVERAAGATGNSGNRGSVSAARRNLIAGARELLRVTNGKGIIFSSGASDLLGLRGPADVMNL